MNVPLWGNEIHLSHKNNRQSILENVSGPEFVWEARFPGEWGSISVDSVECEAEVQHIRGSGTVSSIRLRVEPGQKIVVGVVK